MSSEPKNIEYSTPAIEAFYREHRVRWDQFYESERVMFERLGLTPSSSVLDIGCGCGGLGLALRERFGVVHYTGVEINRQAAQSAAIVNPQGRFLAADILAVAPAELAAASFDLVVSLGCIDWNVQFPQMLARAYEYVKPGGCFLSSFRLTPGASLFDLQRSYQYINFEGKREGEVAPYVVLNPRDLMSMLTVLHPERIAGFGYWGTPSASAVTELDRVVFAVVAVQKGTAPAQRPVVDLDLPQEVVSAIAR
jgi:SAM-dependent methyltransferase